MHNYRYTIRTDGHNVYIINTATGEHLNTFAITKYPRRHHSNDYRDDPAWRRASTILKKLNNDI